MSSIWNHSSTVPESINRPAKRRRSQRSPIGSPSNEGNRIEAGSTGPTLPHTRVIVACKACRGRKTKCDGARPSCTFCASRSIACSYDELPPLSDVPQPLGSQILDAIDNLAGLVRKQHEREHQTPTLRCSRCQSGHGPQRDLISTPDDHHTSSPATSVQQIPTLSNELHANTQDVNLWEGLQSILQWPVFPPDFQLLPIYDDKVIQLPLSQTLPPQEYSELLRFETRYIEAVHTKNPMLDLRELRCKITQVSENGLDWSTSTCLVTLVCAIGALCNPHGFDESSSDSQKMRNRDTEIAAMYWSVASKRIGLVVGENSLEAAQCLCLAGIWYICNFQPLQAWKYFTMAGNCWYLATVVRYPKSALESNVSLRSIEQATFFTSYKSELELRFELGIRGSILDHFESPHSFPLPPNLDDPALPNAASERERTGWYYYLSEIAARHLINRILKSRSRTQTKDLSPRRLRGLFSDLEMFESQLSEWHRSLSPRVSFPLPDDSGEPLPDDFKQILRSRFMFARDLCYRSFIELCLDNSLDLADDMMKRVAHIASQGLQNCVWRLQFMSCRHAYSQGLWFMIRAAVSSAMILIGAVRAQRDSTFPAAALLEIPPDWHQQVVRVLKILTAFEQEQRGGVMDCLQLTRRALHDLGPLSVPIVPVCN
ncbi:hypothetical protein BX600DRAFT_63778 [Xylariales sp. PMI_506]|nr:hypothetical protein BX600DRAFT_63778 [Xylariales sp. PMI_506]